VTKSPSYCHKVICKRSKITFPDQAAPNVMLIQSGFTKCFFNEENDKEFIVEFLGKGNRRRNRKYRQMPCLCNIEAITSVSAFVIPSAIFKNYWVKT
jgi:CRP-like cAMP-binding protein